jgi:hypothetical protein
MTKQYTITWHENGEIKRTISNLDKYQAYEQGIPEEALAKYPSNKWHFIVRDRALSLLENLEREKSIVLSYSEGDKDIPVIKVIVTAM